MDFRLTISNEGSKMLGATLYPSKDKLPIQQQLKKANQKFIGNY